MRQFGVEYYDKLFSNRQPIIKASVLASLNLHEIFMTCELQSCLSLFFPSVTLDKKGLLNDNLCNGLQHKG